MWQNLLPKKDEELAELKQFRTENIELKQSLHALKECCDTNLALKDEEIKQANKVNNSKID